MMPHPGSTAYLLGPALLALFVWSCWTILLLKRDWESYKRRRRGWPE